MVSPPSTSASRLSTALKEEADFNGISSLKRRSVRLLTKTATTLTSTGHLTSISTRQPPAKLLSRNSSPTRNNNPHSNISMTSSSKSNSAASSAPRALSRVAYSKVPSDEEEAAGKSPQRRTLRSSKLSFIDNSNNNINMNTPTSNASFRMSDSSTLADSIIGVNAAVIPEKERLALPWWHKNRLVFYTFQECPKYLQDNDFIIGHYRANYTFAENWISLFFLHNEFVNVWTHLLSFALFVGVLTDIIAGTGNLEAMFGLDYSLSAHDRLVLSGFIIGTSIGFMCSSMFHLHLSCNERVFKFFGCLDYSGISLIIFSSTASFCYYLFYCYVPSRNFWLVGLFLINLSGVIGPFTKRWAGPAFRPVRATVYILSGAFTIAPLLHYAIFLRSDIESRGSMVLPAWDDYALWALPLSVLAYFIGVIIYVCRLPERFSPGSFDIFFASHQIWHVFVFAGAALHLTGVLSWINWRQTRGTC